MIKANVLMALVGNLRLREEVSLAQGQTISHWGTRNENLGFFTLGPLSLPYLEPLALIHPNQCHLWSQTFHHLPFTEMKTTDNTTHTYNLQKT